MSFSMRFRADGATYKSFPADCWHLHRLLGIHKRYLGGKQVLSTAIRLFVLGTSPHDGDGSERRFSIHGVRHHKPPSFDLWSVSPRD